MSYSEQAVKDRVPAPATLEDLQEWHFYGRLHGIKHLLIVRDANTRQDIVANVDGMTVEEVVHDITRPLAIIGENVVWPNFEIVDLIDTALPLNHRLNSLRQNQFIESLSVSKIQQLFFNANLTPIIGDWFGLDQNHPSKMPPDRLLAANIIGICLLDQFSPQEAWNIYKLPRKTRFFKAASSLDTDILTLFWLERGWVWSSCGQEDAFEYPPFLNDKYQHAYRLGLSASKKLLGDDPEVRRAYMV